MKNSYIYLVVCVGGASVLAIEILGSRIIGPFYGVSLFLWSALITVTLAALSLGYALGGHWADKGPTLFRLSALPAVAGMWIVFIPLLKTPVISVAEPFGLRFAVLTVATILFFPPLTLLGMVSPYSIRLKASSLDVVGRTAGNLYAVSTIASVVAALVTGFFLIPNVGVNRLTFMIGSSLLGTAAVGFVLARRSRAVLVLLPFFAVTFVPGFSGRHIGRAPAGNELLAARQSAYAEIRVIDKDGLRYLVIDGGVHTIVDPKTWMSHFPYVSVLDIGKRYFEKPGRLLLIGLGGGSVVKNYAADGWLVDAVEIDPAVTEMAYQYFGLKPSEATVHHMDGRQFLLAGRRRSEIIVLDAFGSSSIPFHLATREAFGLVSSNLAPNGIFAVNIEALGWNDVIVLSLAATLKTCFENVLVLPIAEPPNRLGNVVLFASNRPLDLADEPPVPESRFGAAYAQFHAWENRFAPDTSGAPILSDDLNPIDLWAERINLTARRKLHKFFGDGGLSW